MKKDTILITGGSSGIGLQLAYKFAADGHPLVLVALPGAELDQAKMEILARYPNIIVHTFGCDLSREDGPEKTWAFTVQEGIQVDVLVNNAGFGTWGFLPDISEEREIAMLRLNIEALYKLTRRFLPGMIARKKGHILHIASIASFQPNPYMATYGASKAFVRSFSQALEWELQDQKSPVTITTICPPATRTPFREASGMEDSTLFSGWLAVDIPLVVEAAYRGYKKRQGLVIPGRLYRIVAVFARLMPESVSTWLALNSLRKGIRHPIREKD